MGVLWENACSITVAAPQKTIRTGWRLSKQYLLCWKTSGNTEIGTKPPAAAALQKYSDLKHFKAARGPHE